MAPLDQFILFGDSITEMAYDQELGFGFASHLQHVYRRKLDVINRGFSGYNTRDALKVLPDFFPTPQQANVRFLMIFFGTNDACLPTGNTGQHVPVEEFKSNILTIINHPLVKAFSPAAHIILVTPPPIEETLIQDIDPEMGGKGINRTAQHTALYADAVKEVGLEASLPVVDLWEAMMMRAGAEDLSDRENLPGAKHLGKNEVLEDYLFDGLHLSPEGYRKLYDELIDVLTQYCTDLLPANLPLFGYVPWEIDTVNTWGKPEVFTTMEENKGDWFSS